MSKAITRAHLNGIRQLESMGIKTAADLDAMIADVNSPYYCESRFGALKALVGYDAACWILNDLAINACCK